MPPQNKSDKSSSYEDDDDDDDDHDDESSDDEEGDDDEEDNYEGEVTSASQRLETVKQHFPCAKKKELNHKCNFVSKCKPKTYRDEVTGKCRKGKPPNNYKNPPTTGKDCENLRKDDGRFEWIPTCRYVKMCPDDKVRVKRKNSTTKKFDYRCVKKDNDLDKDPSDMYKYKNRKRGPKNKWRPHLDILDKHVVQHAYANDAFYNLPKPSCDDMIHLLKKKDYNEKCNLVNKCEVGKIMTKRGCRNTENIPEEDKLPPRRDCTIKRGYTRNPWTCRWQKDCPAGYKRSLNPFRRYRCLKDLKELNRTMKRRSYIHTNKTQPLVDKAEAESNEISTLSENDFLIPPNFNIEEYKTSLASLRNKKLHMLKMLK